MSATLRLAIAVGLGLVAAGLNAWLLARPGVEVVAVSRDFKAGAAMTVSDLRALTVSGDAESLRAACVPWEDRALLEGVAAPRTFAPGDVVLQRDLREAFAVAERGLEPVKFRVIAVGSRFKRSPADGATGVRFAGGENSVTVAVKAVTGQASPDDTTEAQRAARRLLRIVARGRDESVAPEDRIRGVAVFPPRSDDAAAASARNAEGIELNDDEMAITVPLDGIDSVPEVILVGGEIGFFLGPEFP